MSRFKSVIIIGGGTIAVTILKYCMSLKERYRFGLSYICSQDNEQSVAEDVCVKHNIEWKKIADKKILSCYLSDISMPTLLISAGNYYLFPEKVIKNSNLEIINFHNALLPHYKGRNAPSWVIFNNETETGATWHYVDTSIDGGDIIWQGAYSLSRDIKAWQLEEAITEIAQRGIEEFLPKLLTDKIEGKKQENVTEKIYHSKEIPGNGYFDMTDDPIYIYNILRALDYSKAHLLGYVGTLLEDGRKVQIEKYKIIKDSKKEQYVEHPDSLILDYDEGLKLYMKYSVNGYANVLGLSLTSGEEKSIRERYRGSSFKNIKLEENLVYDSEEYNKICKTIQNERIEILIANRENYNIVSRIAWECDLVKKCVVLNPTDIFPIESENIRRSKKMWNMLAVMSEKTESSGMAEQSGWFDSLDGSVFSKAEMSEYTMDTYKKVAPYCNSETNLLEVGIGSGLICDALYKNVKKYIGIDISDKTLSITEKRMKEKEATNIELKYGSAMDIDSLDLPQIDIIVMNSVAQYFPGYMYFITVIKKAVHIIGEHGVIFVGDLPDYEKREKWKAELSDNGKSINQSDLWYSKKFINSIPAYVKGIAKVEITQKIGNIENELTKNRMDVMMIVDKNFQRVVGKQKSFEEVKYYDL